MAWDIATATARVPGGSNAALIQTAFDAALAVAERYCDRQFLYAAERATFTHPFTDGLQLSRYPIEQVVAITGGTGVTIKDYHAEKGTGLIVLDGVTSAHQVQVDYAGGYKTLPADLELALWMVFDAIWAQVSNIGAAAAPSAITSVSIPDVGKITLSDGGAASSGGAMNGLIPGFASAILDLYRLRQC